MGYLDNAGLSRFYAGIKSRFLLKTSVANNLTTAASGYALDARQGTAINELIKQSASPYTHTKSDTVNALTGIGKLGFVKMTADYTTGDNVTVNGGEVTIVGDLAGAINGSSVLFSIEGTTLYVYAISSPFIIADGDTALPINDVDIWLSCAGINAAEAGHPTLSEVVASATWCTTLMNSANAVNYLIRSATIQTAVIGSETAVAALDSSSPFKNIQMTADSDSGYVASASSATYSPAYKITCPVGYGSWQTGAGNGAWCAIQIPKSIWCYKVKCNACTSNQLPLTWKIQASTDGSAWEDLTDTVTNSSNTALVTFMAHSAAKLYNRFRFYAVSVGSGEPSVFARGLELYGKTREV